MKFVRRSLSNDERTPCILTLAGRESWNCLHEMTKSVRDREGKRARIEARKFVTSTAQDVNEQSRELIPRTQRCSRMQRVPCPALGPVELQEQGSQWQEMRSLRRLPADPQDDVDEESMRVHKNVMVEGEASCGGCIEEDGDVKAAVAQDGTEWDPSLLEPLLMVHV